MSRQARPGGNAAEERSKEGESLRVMIAAGAAHNEAAWGRRIKKAIPFLLGA